MLDIGGGRLVLETGICIDCYMEMRDDPRSCFYKEFDLDRFECSKACPDRHVCMKFDERLAAIDVTEARRKTLLRDLNDQRKLRAEARRQRGREVFRRGSILGRVFRMATEGTTLPKIRYYCQDIGADYKMPLRIIRSGYHRGLEWVVDEDPDTERIKITIIQQEKRK